MRYLPKYYDLIDDVFDNLTSSFRQETIMKTDIKEKDGNYLMEVELPGYKKENVSVDLEDGYLTIKAERHESNEAKDVYDKVIRQERYSGSMQRSFYVGKNITVEDVKARFEDGILHLTVPSHKELPAPQAKSITIE